MGSRLLALVTRGWERFAGWHANLGAVLLLANVIMLSLFIFITATGRDVYINQDPDFEEWWGTATSLLETGVYGNTFESPTRMRQPFYPYFLASLRAIQGDSFEMLRLSQIVFILAGVLAAYYLARALWDHRVALAGALLVAVHPTLIFNAVLVVNDPHFILFLLLGLICLVRVTQRPSIWLTLLAGALLGLAALTRPVAFPIPFLIGALWLLPWKFLPMSFSRRLAYAAALIGVALVVMLPWAIRNYNVMGAFTFLSSERGVSLWWAAQPGWRWGYFDPLVEAQNRPEFYQIRGGTSFLTGHYFFSQATEEAFTQAAIRHILADPFTWAAKNTVKLALNLLLLPGANAWSGPVWLLVEAFHLALLGLAAWGVARLRQVRREHLLVLLVGLYFIPAHFPFYITTRHFEPAIAIFALFAGFALNRILQRAAPPEPEREPSPRAE